MNEQIRYYKLRAKEYEAIYQKPERQHDLSRIREYLSQQFKDQEILEIACGTGYWTQILATSAHKILATDINSEVLDIAKHKSYTPAKVKFQVQDLFRLREPKYLHGGLFGGFILSHISRSQWQQFFTLCLSQIQKGSTMIFLDNRYVAGSSTPISKTDQDHNTYQIRRLRSGEVFEIMKNFPTESDIKQCLAQSIEDWEWKTWKHYWLLQCKKR
ncbi:MAG: methyltransferase domain-containing protein [Cyanothece sp. SIO1E1]|nr:methyltransferase domain-containing protein [Cyanothece sp. SIO1E1]